MKMLPMRFPVTVEARVKALIGPISSDEGYEATRVTMSFILRMALLEGLKLLEKRYAGQS